MKESFALGRLLANRTESGRILVGDCCATSEANTIAREKQILCQIATTDPVVLNVSQATFEVLMYPNGHIHPESVVAVVEGQARIDKETIPRPAKTMIPAADEIPDGYAVNSGSQT